MSRTRLRKNEASHVISHFITILRAEVVELRWLANGLKHRFLSSHPIPIPGDGTSRLFCLEACWLGHYHRTEVREHPVL